MGRPAPFGLFPQWLFCQFVCASLDVELVAVLRVLKKA